MFYFTVLIEAAFFICLLFFSASFRTKKQLPIKGEADMVRYSLSHDTKADHPSFKNPIGIRIIAKRCTIFIDDIKFKYHRIKE